RPAGSQATRNAFPDIPAAHKGACRPRPNTSPASQALIGLLTSAPRRAREWPVAQRIDARQVAPLLVIVHAEAEDVTVRQNHAVEVGLDALDHPAVRLAAHAGNEHPARAAAQAIFADRLERGAL